MLFVWSLCDGLWEAGEWRQLKICEPLAWSGVAEVLKCSCGATDHRFAIKLSSSSCPIIIIISEPEPHGVEEGELSSRKRFHDVTLVEAFLAVTTGMNDGRDDILVHFPYSHSCTRSRKHISSSNLSIKSLGSVRSVIVESRNCSFIRSGLRLGSDHPVQVLLQLIYIHRRHCWFQKDTSRIKRSSP